MAKPNRNNPYSFNEYLAWREGVDYYADDAFLQRVVQHFCGGDAEKADARARAISKKASFRWRQLAEEASRPEKRPLILHYDGHGNRIDRIVRPKEIEIMEKEVFGERLFSDSVTPWEKLVSMYIIYQNSEACIACPLVCTEGLVKLLEKFANTPETLRILTHCKEGIDGEMAIGAQYLSEIHGGSDVGANLLEAVETNGTWRLYGKKFFCSAAHADYAVITAKPTDSEKVGLFVMPSWLPGNKEKEIRNGYTIDRLKWKMGTCELPTAEITFNGAIAYPVGPLERGLANVVGIVLTYSRLTVGLAAGAGMARGVREAKKYSEFREAFGMKIGDFPLVKVQLEKIEQISKKTTAGAFKLYSEFLTLEGGAKGGLVTNEPLEMRRKRFDVRELIMLQKITAAADSTDVAHTAMSIFGGHGVMEDFSSLPRFYRDAAVNELWEGPRNVLLTQIFNDLKRAAEWYPASDFVASILRGADRTTIQNFANELNDLMKLPHLFGHDAHTLEACARWDRFCENFFHAYQEIALAEVEGQKEREEKLTAATV
ncbi:MAG: acyl-CoA dehydrogenase family protein [Spirochaetes bacterium]|nr:acyl-CoA dehydrogenase family protein [Spirochaetota bacterium]